MARKTAGKNKRATTPRFINQEISVKYPEVKIPETKIPETKLPDIDISVETIERKFHELIYGPKKLVQEQEINVEMPDEITDLVDKLKNSSTDTISRCDEELKSLENKLHAESRPNVHEENSATRIREKQAELLVKQRQIDINLAKSKNKLQDIEREYEDVLALKKNFQKEPLIPILEIPVIPVIPAKPVVRRQMSSVAAKPVIPPIRESRITPRSVRNSAISQKPQTAPTPTIRKTVSSVQSRTVAAK